MMWSLGWLGYIVLRAQRVVEGKWRQWPIIAQVVYRPLRQWGMKSQTHSISISKGWGDLVFHLIHFGPNPNSIGWNLENIQSNQKEFVLKKKIKLINFMFGCFNKGGEFNGWYRDEIQKYIQSNQKENLKKLNKFIEFDEFKGWYVNNR